MKILVMSDTHGLLRPQVKEMLGKCDAVIHGGDFHTKEIAEEIQDSVRTGVPVFMVRGNNDKGWAAHLPEHLEFVLSGVKFYVVHDQNDLPEGLSGCQAVIFGHSHRYSQEWKDGRLYLNPGSCGKRRFRLAVTMAVLNLEDEKLSVERIDISDDNKKKGRITSRKGSLSDAIREIMARMDKGQQIGKISRELKLELEFVEEICRIRATHPGVTANGILDKIEVNQRTQRK